MRACVLGAAPRLLVLTVVGAISFTAPASIGFAQSSKGGKSENSVAEPHTLPGVTVQAPPKLHDRIPPAKRAAFDAEAADRKAWTNYRATAAAAHAPKGPGASPNTENHPGLRKLDSR